MISNHWPLSLMSRLRILVKHIFSKTTSIREATHSVAVSYSNLDLCYSSHWCHKITMSSLQVKNFENDDRLQIFLHLSVSGAMKSFNLNRLKTEELGLAVERLRLNLSKKVSKKKKKKNNKKNGAAQTNVNNDQAAEMEQETEEEQIPIEILHNGKTIDMTVSNVDAWIEGAVLKVGEEEIAVTMNPPSAKLEKLPATIMADFPLFPEVETEFCDKNSCKFYWKIVEKRNVDEVKLNIKHDKVDLTGALKNSHFTPTEAHLGHHVLLCCVPQNEEKSGKMEAVVSDVPVSMGPGACPFEKRHEFTKMRAENGMFRVISYNILADIYANTDFARNELFSYCASHALDMDYRKHLLLKEIVGYQGDVVCLQEVDSSVFSSHLKPAMEMLNYHGLFRPKTGSVSEGSATFIYKDKFRVVKELDIVLSEFLANDSSCGDLWGIISEVPVLKERLEQRSSILQVTVVESTEKPGSFLCVANTHLYFHPTADNIRLIHAMTALRYIQTVCQAYQQEGKDISMVFCGDFNSSPHNGVYQLMIAQFIPKDHGDWSYAGPEEMLAAMELSHTMNIESACGVPEFTNFTAGFKSTLDYIFINADRLKVNKVVPFPEREELEANVAVPSVVFPSDHLALVSDLEFRS